MIFIIIKLFKKLFTRPEKCLACGKYPCKTCNCAYDTAQAALNCEEWDKILKHKCRHTHEHDEEDDGWGISPEQQWLIDHPEITKLYAGRMVAVKTEQGIVASGNNLDEVRAELTAKGIPKSHTMFTRIPDYEGEVY